MKAATWCDICRGFKPDGAVAWGGSQPVPTCNVQEHLKNAPSKVYIEPLIDLGTGIAQGDMTITRKINEIIKVINNL